MRIGILFDLDGTLLDTLQDLQDSVNHALEVFGFPRRSYEEVRSFVGNGAAHLIRQAVPADCDEAMTASVLAEFRRHYDDNCRNKTQPYPGILQALEEVRGLYPTAIVSNKPDSAVKELCSIYFPGVYALGETSGCPRKPAPDMVFKAMGELDVDSCVYVGDSEVDVLTARNAGVPCLSVLWGFRDRPELAAAGGSCFCGNTRDLPGIIRRLAESIGK